MSRKTREYPLLDDSRNFPTRFGLLDEINFLLDRCADCEVERRAANLEAAKLRAYCDILDELNAALDLYFDLKAAVETVKQLLPRRGRLGRRLIETPESQRLKSELSRLHDQLRKITDRVAELRKKFWYKVVEQDPDLYPFDLDHFGKHMADIDAEVFEL